MGVRSPRVLRTRRPAEQEPRTAAWKGVYRLPERPKPFNFPLIVVGGLTVWSLGVLLLLLLGE